MTDAELEEIRESVHIVSRAGCGMIGRWLLDEGVPALIAEAERLRDENLNLDGLLRAQAHEIAKLQKGHESNRRLKQRLYRWEQWAEKVESFLLIYFPLGKHLLEELDELRK